MKKGLMLTNAMLSTETDPTNFLYAMDVLSQYDISVIEYYTKDENLAVKYGKIINERGYINIFHSALDQKRSGWCRLCDENEANRQKSLDFSKWSIEKAIKSGAIKAVVQTGRPPENPLDENICLEAFAKSMNTLSGFVGGDILLGIEPCDRAIDAKQLFGPTMETYSFIKELNLKNISLTLDTAHIALLYEDPITVIEVCKPYCSSIHLANCIMDRNDPLCGDKHPLFTVPNGKFSDEDAQKMLENIQRIYAGEEVHVSVEMICREDDERLYLEKMINSMPWFFKKMN